MTQLVAVQTDFRDIEQMAEGLAGRVQESHLILPAGISVEEGEWAQFEIALSDGHPGLSGLGRCVTVVDNGDERPPHQRYDVVFDSLQFDTHEQRVFEHVLARQGQGGRELDQVSDMDAESLPPVPSEDTGSFVDVSTDFSGAISVAPEEVESAERGDGDYRDDDEHTMIAHADEIDSAFATLESVPAPGGEDNDAGRHAGNEAPPPLRSGGYVQAYGHAAGAHALSTAALQDDFEEPLSGERLASARALEGSPFAYHDGIPFPAQPPRPELDSALRVTPAPRPARLAGH